MAYKSHLGYSKCFSRCQQWSVDRIQQKPNRAKIASNFTPRSSSLKRTPKKLSTIGVVTRLLEFVGETCVHIYIYIYICVFFTYTPQKLEEELPEFLRFEVVTFLVCVFFWMEQTGFIQPGLDPGLIGTVSNNKKQTPYTGWFNNGTCIDTTKK